MQAMSAKRILVVDDSPTARFAVTEILQRAGYEVLSAEDGQQAVDLIEREPLAAVVLDIILPKKNGYQVCRHLKTDVRYRDTKVLLLTSKNQDADLVWGRRQGADGYLTKPFEEQQLLASIQQLLEETSSLQPTTLWTR
jgi:twitching motility two-component system response regulator PilH